MGPGRGHPQELLLLGQKCVRAMGMERTDNVDAFGDALWEFLAAGGSVDARYHKADWQSVSTTTPRDEVGREYTLLMYAVSKSVRAVRCSDLLLANGADMSLRRPQGSSCVEMALVAVTSRHAMQDPDRLLQMTILNKYAEHKPEWKQIIEEAWANHLTLGMIHLFNAGNQLSDRRKIYRRMALNGFEPENKRFIYGPEYVHGRYNYFKCCSFDQFRSCGRMPSLRDGLCHIDVEDDMFVIFLSMRGMSSLDEYTQYRNVCDIVEHLLGLYGRPPTAYIFIEDACMDQEAFNALPMFIASSTMLVHMANDNYAWTRLHRQVAKASGIPRFEATLRDDNTLERVSVVPPESPVENPKGGNFMALPSPHVRTRHYAAEELSVVAHQVFLASKFTQVRNRAPAGASAASPAGSIDVQVEAVAGQQRRCCTIS